MFSSPMEVKMAYESKKLGLHAQIKVRIKGKIIDTTTGRVIFNEIVPEGMPYINDLLKKKKIIEIIGNIYKTLVILKQLSS
jgi:DNA-directed RNA polymerase subunit beta'